MSRSVLVDKSAITYEPLLTDYRFKDKTNLRVGRLTVLGYGGFRSGRSWWWCQCDCGNCLCISDVYTTQSCGCYNTARIKEVNIAHGESINGQISPEYDAYRAAKHRCMSTRPPHFARYRERGIQFLFTSFQEFLAEVGRRPTPQHSIDRIDNDGNYEPGNVRWATATEQTNNQRRNHRVTARGETLTIGQWAKKLGVRTSRIHQRIAYGYCEPCAVTLPKRGICNHR